MLFLILYLFPAIAAPVNVLVIIDNQAADNSDIDKLITGTPPLNDNTISYRVVKGDLNSLKSADSQYVIYVRKLLKGDTDYLEGIIFPKGAADPLYTTVEKYQGLASPDSIKQILIRAHLRINNKLDYIRKIIIENDKKNNPVLTWDSPLNSAYYEIYRSKFQDKDFNVIGKSSEKKFTDRDSEEGLQYWYMVKPVNDSVFPDFSQAVSWYRKPAEPVYENLEKILNQKTVSVKKQQADDIKREEILKEFYWNEIKLRIILTLAKPYTAKGTLSVIKNNSDYTVDEANKTITVNKKNALIKLNSNSFFKFYKKYKETRPDDLKQMVDILMANSVLFCVYDGLREIKNSDGTVSFVHHYRAAGLTSEYVKNRKDWRSHTVLFGTSDKEIKNEIQKIQKKSDE
jgi:hypothetical protein